MLRDDEIKEREIERQLRIGARIDRDAAHIKLRVASRPPDPVSTGPSLALLICDAIEHPGLHGGGRPHGDDGAVSFHFDVSHANRAPDFPLPGGSRSSTGKAAAHQRYVERAGAVEAIEVDRRLPEAAAAQDYVDRDSAVERLPDRIRMCGGTLPEDKKQRMDLWRRIEAIEPPPKTFTIIALRDHDEKFWGVVADANKTVPETLRDLAEGESESFVVDAKEAERIAAFVIAHADQGREAGGKPAIKIEPGRAGRIQSRLIAELPADLSPRARLEIVQRFCRDEFESRSLPYYYALHAPSKDNDSRNFHAHILWYERPIARDPDVHGSQWDFEIAVVDHDTKNRKTRLGHPFRQQHNRDIAQIGWVGAARARFAGIVNEVAGREGAATRYDPRNYWQMGITTPKVPRCDPKAFAKAKRGVPTRAAELTIKEQWRREKARLAKLYDTVSIDPNIRERFAAVTAAAKTRRAFSEANTWKLKLGAFVVATKDKRAALANKAALDFNLARIRSRVSPPIDNNNAATKRAIADYLARLRADLLAPIEAAYRHALATERQLLGALAQREREPNSEVAKPNQPPPAIERGRPAPAASPQTPANRPGQPKPASEWKRQQIDAMTRQVGVLAATLAQSGDAEESGRADSGVGDFDPANSSPAPPSKMGDAAASNNPAPETDASSVDVFTAEPIGPSTPPADDDQGENSSRRAASIEAGPPGSASRQEKTADQSPPTEAGAPPPPSESPPEQQPAPDPTAMAKTLEEERAELTAWLKSAGPRMSLVFSKQDGAFLTAYDRGMKLKPVSLNQHLMVHARRYITDVDRLFPATPKAPFHACFELQAFERRGAGLETPGPWLRVLQAVQAEVFHFEETFPLPTGEAGNSWRLIDLSDDDRTILQEYVDARELLNLEMKRPAPIDNAGAATRAKAPSPDAIAFCAWSALASRGCLPDFVVRSVDRLIERPDFATYKAALVLDEWANTRTRRDIIDEIMPLRSRRDPEFATNPPSPSKIPDSDREIVAALRVLVDADRLDDAENVATRLGKRGRNLVALFERLKSQRGVLPPVLLKAFDLCLPWPAPSAERLDALLIETSGAPYVFRPDDVSESKREWLGLCVHLFLDKESSANGGRAEAVIIAANFDLMTPLTYLVERLGGKAAATARDVESLKTIFEWLRPPRTAETVATLRKLGAPRIAAKIEQEIERAVALELDE